jgi:hypothetical protein
LQMLGLLELSVAKRGPNGMPLQWRISSVPLLRF